MESYRVFLFYTFLIIIKNVFNPQNLHFTLRFSIDGRPSWDINSLYTPTSFCSLIKHSKEGLERCLKCDRQAFQIACQTKKPYIYECHAGLIDGVIPIMLGDNPVAFLMFGQFLTEPPSEGAFDEIWENIKDLPVNYEEMKEAFMMLPSFPLHYVEGIAQGMFQVLQDITMRITELLLPERSRKDANMDLELWLAQQEWQILHIFKKERELLSLFTWATGRAVRHHWDNWIEEELRGFNESPWEVKSRIWGVISSFISHLRVFQASSKINLLELALHYGSMIMKCTAKENLKETLSWIINDLLTIRGETTYRDSIVERTKTYILQNYAREDLGLKEVARAMRLSPYYLARLFKTAEGISVGSYIREVRIERAKELLERTELPVIEVALEVGYSDPAQFSKVFKKKTGIAPSQYRRARKI